MRRQRQRHPALLHRSLRGGDRGLSERARAPSRGRGEPVDRIASVASLFVSRVDTKADAALPPDSPLRGRVAVANALVAYARYRQPASPASAGQRLRRPRRQAAAPALGQHRDQDPSYSDVRLRRAPDRSRRHQHHAREHPARVRRSRHVGTRWTPTPGERGAILAAAAAPGVDLDAITAELEREGVESFGGSYARALATASRPSWAG